jgi:hypothetical protein
MSLDTRKGNLGTHLVVEHHHLLLITQGHFFIIVNVLCFLTFKQSMQMEASGHDRKLFAVMIRLK